MRVVFFLPRIAPYIDRAEMVREISQGVDELFLIVGWRDVDLEVDGYPNFRVIDAGFKAGHRLYNLWKLNLICEKLIKSHNIDIVHDTFGNFLPLLLFKKRVDSVVFCSSFYTIEGWRIRHAWGDKSTFELLRRRSTAMMFYGALQQKLIARYTDYLILQAPGLISRLQEDVQIENDRIHILPNSVSLKNWYLPTVYKKDNAEIRLLFVGSIDVTRGALALVQVMKMLKERGIPAILTMVGGWELSTKGIVEDFIKKNQLGSHIRFLGRLPQSDVLQTIHSHDVFVYQTNNDASPRVVLEAMASGIPVIASHHPGIDILDSEQKGIMFTNYGDVEQIFAFIEHILGHQKYGIDRGLVGRKLVENEFSSIPVSKKYVAFYKCILKKKRT